MIPVNNRYPAGFSKGQRRVSQRRRPRRPKQILTSAHLRLATHPYTQPHRNISRPNDPRSRYLPSSEISWSHITSINVSNSRYDDLAGKVDFPGPIPLPSSTELCIRVRSISNHSPSPAIGCRELTTTLLSVSIHTDTLTFTVMP